VSNRKLDDLDDSVASEYYEESRLSEIKSVEIRKNMGDDKYLKIKPPTCAPVINR
jgi:hypothetical protein